MKKTIGIFSSTEDETTIVDDSLDANSTYTENATPHMLHDVISGHIAGVETAIEDIVDLGKIKSILKSETTTSTESLNIASSFKYSVDKRSFILNKKLSLESTPDGEKIKIILESFSDSIKSLWRKIVETMKSIWDFIVRFFKGSAKESKDQKEKTDKNIEESNESFKKAFDLNIDTDTNDFITGTRLNKMFANYDIKNVNDINKSIDEENKNCDKILELSKALKETMSFIENKVNFSLDLIDKGTLIDPSMLIKIENNEVPLTVYITSLHNDVKHVDVKSFFTDEMYSSIQHGSIRAHLNFINGQCLLSYCKEGHSTGKLTHLTVSAVEAVGDLEIPVYYLTKDNYYAFIKKLEKYQEDVLICNIKITKVIDEFLGYQNNIISAFDELISKISEDDNATMTSVKNFQTVNKTYGSDLANVLRKLLISQCNSVEIYNNYLGMCKRRIDKLVNETKHKK